MPLDRASEKCEQGVIGQLVGVLQISFLWYGICSSGGVDPGAFRNFGMRGREGGICKIEKDI